MSFNYKNIQATSRRLLAKFGQSITLTQQTASEYDSDTGGVTSTTATTIDNGVILPYSNGIQNATGSLIQQGDAQILIQCNVVPKPNDTLTIQSQVWTIINVKALEPAGINMLYECQVRK